MFHDGHSRWLAFRGFMKGFSTIFLSALAVCFTSTFTQSVQGAAVASDNACNAPYSGTNWSNGQNGGTGFGPWIFQGGSTGVTSFFTYTASDNGNNCSSGAGIDGSCGAS